MKEGTQNYSKKSFNLESFHQLLRGRIFYGDMDYGAWLMDCIIHATLPISPMFSIAIKEFVMSVFVVDRVRKIPEESLLPYFEEPSNISPAQVLIALYVLTYHDALIASKTDPKFSNSRDIPQEEYSFADSIPIRSMLNHIESDTGYRGIYRDFVAMAANMYPEFFDVTGLLLQESKEDLAVVRRAACSAGYLSYEKCSMILAQWQSYPDQISSLLSRISAMETVDVVPFAELFFSVLLMPCLEEKNGSDMIIESLVSAWESLDRVIPHELWVIVANALRGPQLEGKYTFDMIVRDPLSLFKCDSRLYRSEKLIGPWLHTQFNARNVMALINAQDTAMIQTLLEYCKPTEQDKARPGQRYICQFIHSLFIDGDSTMLIAKILHFQTYSIELIPLVADLIPSLFAVMNFIPELLRQPQPDKQVFGILLACHLCEKYPLEQYLVVVEKYVLPRLLKIAFPPPSTVCVPSEFLVQAIPGFVHIARAFPHFGPHIIQAFDEIGKGLPAPEEFIGQEGNSKIILVLRLHQVLNESREFVQSKIDASVNDDSNL
ncbi:integrator complex subunit 2 [Dichotomocladium elegans]|nr:integrator complex subunit 2 [Dichotomocladium elegans]